MSFVDLGFLEKCESWQVESRLFPSKVGGKPAWLNLANLPTLEQLLCKKCHNSMIFLCQIYAPIEEADHLSVKNFLGNFHRTLFIFVCRNAQCCERNSNKNMRVFRSFLPRDNKFYPYDPPDDKPDPNFSLNKWVKLCNLCGCLSEKQCSKCKNVHYCSREHQIMDWKEGHKKECGTTESRKDRSSKLLFPEWEICTEPEEIEIKTVDEIEELHKFNSLQLERKTGTMTEVSENELDLHAASIHENDKTFARFQKRISGSPDQVIRYQRGGEPLWIAEEPVPDSIPDCEHCGSVRTFEFQLMPQMLSELKEYDLDWGVVAIYTCKDSCISDISYKEEFIFKQDIEIKSS